MIAAAPFPATFEDFCLCVYVLVDEVWPRVAPALRRPRVAPALRRPRVAPALRRPRVAPALRRPRVAPALRRPRVAPALRRPGPPPACSDQELVAMALVGECCGW